jgi:hypothetical protein
MPTIAAITGESYSTVTPIAGTCTCGHNAEAHEHYRHGNDCAICGDIVCGAYLAAVSVVIAP